MEGVGRADANGESLRFGNEAVKGGGVTDEMILGE